MSILTLRDIQGLSAFQNTVRIPENHNLETFGNLISNGKLEANNSLKIPVWSTETRPIVPEIGLIGYNTSEDVKAVEIYDGEEWVPIGSSGFKIDIPENGLSLYLDATNTLSYPGSGNTWFDLSGNKRDFNWVSTPNYTGGSQPYFATLNNRCTGPASNSFGINNNSGYTIFLISKQLSLVSTSAFKFYKNNLGGSSGRGIFTHCTWSDSVVYFDQGGCCGADTRTNVNSGGASDWTIWTFRRLTNSSTRSISKNATTLITNTAAATTIDLDGRGVDLGSSDEYGGNSSTWNAQIGGFIVYNRGLSDQEITTVYNTLRSRYGI